jgi:hypothetical protein
MARNFTIWCGWLVVLRLALLRPAQAQAGDRKPAFAKGYGVASPLCHTEAASETVMSWEIQSVSLRYDAFGASGVRPFEATKRSFADKGVTKQSLETRGSSESRGLAERNPVTLFRFSSKLGDVAVQPVIGDLKGAQFSVGF